MRENIHGGVWIDSHPKESFIGLLLHKKFGSQDSRHIIDSLLLALACLICIIDYLTYS